MNRKARRRSSGDAADAANLRPTGMDLVAVTWGCAIGFALVGMCSTGWILQSYVRPPEVRIDVPASTKDWERIVALAPRVPAYADWNMSSEGTNRVLSLLFHLRADVDLSTISNRLAGELGAPVNAPVVTPWSMWSRGNGGCWSLIGLVGAVAGGLGWTAGRSFSDWKNGVPFARWPGLDARSTGGGSTLPVPRSVPVPLPAPAPTPTPTPAAAPLPTPTPKTALEAPPVPTPAPADPNLGKLGDVFQTDIGMDLLWIPKGEFLMGSPEGEGFDDERPQREVTISRPFWMGKFPVRQRDWLAVMGSNQSHFKGEDRPVETVSWDECVEFGKKLTERMKGRLPAGYEFRLPTEAEWEYACRAGTTTEWSFGDDESALERHGWYGKNAGGRTHPVGEKRANSWELHDMHGGVWERVLDWKRTYPGGRVTDPSGPASGSHRVIRGGSWSYSARLCRSAYRFGFVPGYNWIDLGFRLVLAPRLAV